MGQLDYESRLRTLGLFSIGGEVFEGGSDQVVEGDAGELRELVTVAPDARARGHRFDLLVPPCRSELRRRFLVCAALDYGMVCLPN